jgi:ferredoxin
MVENYKRIIAGEKGLIPPKPEWPKDVKKKDLDPISLNPTFASVLKYHKEKCTYPKCRLCMENCPVNGIDLSFKKPVIAKPCIGCEFCTRLCPTGALDSDEFDRITEKLTVKELTRFYIPYLDKPQKEGKFRPSLPREKWGTGKPIFRSYVHPQWIIGKGLNKLIKQ